MATQTNGQRHDRSALILYGSETGNSEECAEELGRLLQRQHFQCSVRVMDDVEINVLPSYTIVLFAISTTGQGEFPRNARKFWKSLLRKRLPPNCLGHVEFTTFGLGDSSYSKFNWSARKLHKRLEQLGAKEIYPRGEGDDQHAEGWDGTFFSWKVDLGKNILEQYPLPDGEEVIPTSIQLPPKSILKIIPRDERPQLPLLRGSLSSTKASETPSTKDGEESTTANSPKDRTAQADISRSSLPNSSTASESTDQIVNMKIHDPPEWYAGSPRALQQLKHSHPDVDAPSDQWFPPDTLLDIPRSHTVELTCNKRVTPESHWQDVRQLSFLIPDSVDYQPGDVMTIYPKNFPTDVQSLIELQGWQAIADEPLRLERTSEGLNSSNGEVLSYLPHGLRMSEGSTLRDLLTSHLDITAIPKRNFLFNMSYFTTDEMHRERLLEFCNPMYTDEFFDYTSRPRRSILEVLADFPSVQLPWNQAAHIFPNIRGRQFSITTGGALVASPRAGQQRLELLVAIVKYRTVLKKIRQGLCSRYLASLPEGTPLQVTIDRPSDKFYALAFREPHRPLLLIAAGTGIAPCRALVWERAAAVAWSRSHSHHDDDDRSSVGGHVLIYGARNRDADYFFGDEWTKRDLHTQVHTAFSRDQREKVYVQDIVRKRGDEVYRLIFSQGAVVYVCGSAGAMPKSVRQAFLDVLIERLGVGEGGVRDVDVVTKEAETVLEEMTRLGRYIEETW